MAQELLRRKKALAAATGTEMSSGKGRAGKPAAKKEKKVKQEKIKLTGPLADKVQALGEDIAALSLQLKDLKSAGATDAVKQPLQDK